MNVIKILKAWNVSIRQKSEHSLAHCLHNDCKIEYSGRSQIQTKDEHLKWCKENTEAKGIRNFKIIYDDKWVMLREPSCDLCFRGSGLMIFFWTIFRYGCDQLDNSCF